MQKSYNQNKSGVQRQVIFGAVANNGIVKIIKRAEN